MHTYGCMHMTIMHMIHLYDNVYMLLTYGCIHMTITYMEHTYGYMNMTIIHMISYI